MVTGRLRYCVQPGRSSLAGCDPGASAVSYYGICVQVAQPIHGLTAAGLHFLFPHLAMRVASGSISSVRRPVYAAWGKSISLQHQGLSVLLMLLGPRLLMVWMGPMFATHVASLLPVLAVGFGMLAMNVTAHYTLLALGRVHLVTALNVAGGFAMLMAMAVLVHSHGVAGCSVGKALLWADHMPAVSPTTPTVVEGANSIRNWDTADREGRSMMATLSYAVSMEREKMSSAISMPGLVGCYFALRVCITFLFFQSEPQVGAMVSVALNLLLLLPVSVYAVGSASMPIRQAFEARPFRLVVAFLMLGLVSLAWSETPSVVVALGYWAAMASDVLLVLLLVRTDDVDHVTDSMLKGYAWGVLLLCVIAWAAPAMQDLRLGDNEFLTPNLIGFECAFGALLCQYFAPQGARWKWLGVALAITLVRSLSKTTLIAFVIVEVFYLLRTKTIKRSSKIAILVGAVVVAALFSGLFLSYYAVYTNAGNQAETLTGRTAIWLVTFGLAMQKPWLGHGFHSFRSVIPPFGAFEPWHAHNELLQQFFTYGLLGVGLVAMLYISLFRQCRRCLPEPLALTGLALLLLVLIRGLADTEPLRSVPSIVGNHGLLSYTSFEVTQA